MSELHKFIFDGLPVRGMLVRLTDTWTEILRRRASNTSTGTGAYAAPVRDVLGQLVAAATLMQSNIKFDGSLILQILGDGPLKLAVVEVQPDLALRATATVIGPVDEVATLSQMVNHSRQGRCAITLDPVAKLPGQQPYQGVVPLVDNQGQPMETVSAILEQYMRQSEQLDTTLVLAANEQIAAGLLIQRLPAQGQGSVDEHYQRISILAKSLQREELLTLDVQTILHRLFWQEQVRQFEPLQRKNAPRFACSCSRERVARMIVGLGQAEAHSILAERADIEVACDFCGLQYRFDAVDVAQLFVASMLQSPGSPVAH
ncbi:MAG: Hsp33 family molecular chaperone HslO [Rhodoferax sp.]|nr:Hsp33 family molecular chaperone HslO [Rhodoferax sp.]